MAKLSAAELAKREEIIQSMKKNKRSLVKRYVTDKIAKGEEPINPEAVMYGRATNIAKKVTETQMENLNLKKLIRAALMQEKKFPDLTGDGKVTQADILKGRGVDIKEGPKDMYWSEYIKSLVNDIRIKGIKNNERDYTTFSEDDFIADYEDYIGDKMMSEDLDLGHEDDEPHMIKGELYRIGKYAMELYQMVDQFEGEGEVDFPAWWQSKITTAKNMVSSAKHYLEFELKEPEIDAMVGVATGEDIIPNIPSEPLEDEIEEGNLGHNELASLEPEGRFWIVTYRTMDGKKEKIFTDEDEARAFMGTVSEGLPKGYFKKATAELDESFEKLVGKLKKGGKSEKAAKAIAGAVASYKAKGGGKGPTAKQKARG